MPGGISRTTRLADLRGDVLLTNPVTGDVPVYDAPSGLWKNQPSADKTYVHDQQAAASLWTVSHGLGKFPSVIVVDTAGTEVLGNVTYQDANTVSVSFSVPFSGKAFCN